MLDPIGDEVVNGTPTDLCVPTDVATLVSFATGQDRASRSVLGDMIEFERPTNFPSDVPFCCEMVIAVGRSGLAFRAQTQRERRIPLLAGKEVILVEFILSREL